MTLDRSSYPQKVLLWAVACTALFGFFRLGELLLESPTSFNSAASLAWGDVTVDNQTTPTTVRIPPEKVQVRPVWLRDRYRCGSHPQPSLPSGSHCELHMVERGPRPGPFFIDTGGKVITKAQFVGDIRGVLGSPQHQYAGHSFLGLGQRPQLHWLGVEDSTIQALGRCGTVPPSCSI